jgi:dihydroxycyclohexadiene carboxylate dehydrogenase
MAAGGENPSKCRRLEGRVAVVAGGGQGIGSATVRRLVDEGATVVVGDVNPAVDAQLSDVASSISTYVGDLTDRDMAIGLIQTAIERHDRIDVLVNIVGGTIWSKPFVDYSLDEARIEIEKSLWGCISCTWAAVPYMVQRGTGSIVNLGSHAVVSTDRVPYAVAKGGVIALTRSLAMELASSGVRVNCVAPHSTTADDRVMARNADETPADREARHAASTERIKREIPMGRRARAEEQAAAIAFFASDDSSFITGQVLSVGGGALLP